MGEVELDGGRKCEGVVGAWCEGKGHDLLLLQRAE